MALLFASSWLKLVRMGKKMLSPLSVKRELINAIILFGEKKLWRYLKKVLKKKVKKKLEKTETRLKILVDIFPKYREKGKGKTFYVKI
jgi:hypothetical protein